MRLIPAAILFPLLAAPVAALWSGDAAGRDVRIGVPVEPGVAAESFVAAFSAAEELQRADLNPVVVAVPTYEEIVRRLAVGDLDIGAVSLQTFGRMPELGEAMTAAPLLVQPFQFRDMSELFGVEESPLGAAALSEIGRTGLFSLGFWNGGQTQLVAGAQIATREDLVGLKVGTFSSAEQGYDRVAESLGAVDTGMLPGPEMPLAMQQGSVDAFEVMPDLLPGVAELLGSGTVIPSYRPLVGVLAASELFWTDLTEREKEALALATERAADINRSEVMETEQSLRAMLRENRFELLELVQDPAVRAASDAVWSEVFGVETLDALQDVKRTLETPALAPEPSLQPEKRSVAPAGKVLFATDRNDLGDPELRYRFGGKRTDGTLRCGGLSEETQLASAASSPAVVRLDPTTLDEGVDACVDLVAAAAEAASGRLLLYVHGYRNRFIDAAERALLLSRMDTGSSLVVAWSWPSDGWLEAYAYDEDSVAWSRLHLRQFMQRLLAHDSVARVDVLAHSMGNRLSIALLELVDGSGSEGKLGAMVFAAADVAEEIFAQAMERFTPGSLRTLYGSQYDRALKLSETIHRGRRAGSGGDAILVGSGFESIDVDPPRSWKDLLSTGHAYVFELPVVISDVELQLRTLQQANGRGLSQKPGGYWQIK